MDPVDQETIRRLESLVVTHVQITEKRTAILEKLFEELDPKSYPQRKAEQLIKEALDRYRHDGHLYTSMIDEDGKSLTSSNAEYALQGAQRWGVRQDLLQQYAVAIFTSKSDLISHRDKIAAAEFLKLPKEEMQKLYLINVYKQLFCHPPVLSPENKEKLPPEEFSTLVRLVYNERMERGGMQDHYASALLARKYLGQEEKRKAVIQLLVDSPFGLFNEFQEYFYSEEYSVIKQLELSKEEEYTLALRMFEGGLYNFRITEREIKNLVDKYKFLLEEQQTAARIVERHFIEDGDFHAAVDFRKMYPHLLPQEIIPLSDLELLCKYC